jgi:hypothetical protein
MNGILEEWNDGKKEIIVRGIAPIFQYSSIPFFHVLRDGRGTEDES